MRFILLFAVSNFEHLGTAMVFWLEWLSGNPTRLAELAGYTMGNIWAPYLSYYYT